MSDAPEAADGRPSQWVQLQPVLKLLSATAAIGAAGGLVIGGFGGRLAMRILFLTSDSSVRGVTSDDGFEIGRFTLGSTISLLIVTTLIGVVAAVFYLIARPFVTRLPVPVAPAMGLFYGVIGGALMVHRGGIDFRVLKPVMLAIAMFVVICAGFGAAVASMVNRAAKPDAWPRRRSWWTMAPLLLVFIVPPFLVVAVVAVAVNWADGVAQRTRAWRAARFGAPVVMSGLFVLGTVDLARDIVALT